MGGMVYPYLLVEGQKENSSSSVFLGLPMLLASISLHLQYFAEENSKEAHSFRDLAEIK
ncbi:hypothetical protein [Neomoorella mulderi]|uniref:hypothetical protein n=1 Tax=Neomoorella mulderi TaxID=202604 RepID=UPI0013728746|nr:hypothetical protein [Moorella mulderi]